MTSAADLEPPPTLREAMAARREAENQLPPGAAVRRIGLATSFTPLHLQTFVHSRLQQRLPDVRVEIVTGVYGSLIESLAVSEEISLRSCAVVLDWPDLDPRLGMREAVTVAVADDDDVVRTARMRLAALLGALERAGARRRVLVALPGLPLPPAYASPAGRRRVLELELGAMVHDFAARAGGLDGVHVAPELALERDLVTDIRSGFPLSTRSASRMAGVLTDGLLPRPALKGIITDLDDTLWLGLVGEVGPDAVSWDLDAGGQPHALYQQLLGALTTRGVLLGVASKNEPAVVEQALDRADLSIERARIFPVEASWEPKSLSVHRILHAWNISAADVVFIDDNPLELAEVAAAHPSITTRLFPRGDPAALPALLDELNSAFWRDVVGEADRVRVASLRARAEAGPEPDEPLDRLGFLRDLDGTLSVDLDRAADPRLIELVNKTNQFNVNGVRLDETEWRVRTERPGGVVAAVSYTDRFGALGVISVLTGVVRDRMLTVDTWVLSCRAFSRAIEHQMIVTLAQRLDASDVSVHATPTQRNAVATAFLEDVGTPRGDTYDVDLPRLAAHAMMNIHRVSVVPRENNHE